MRTSSCLLLFLALLLPAQVLAWQGKVVKVSDGDTITVLRDGRDQVRVRMYGIDTPEKKQAYGSRATEHLREFAALQLVEVEEQAIDRYGRTVAKVSRLSDDRSLNAEMVAAGLAWVYRQYCTGDLDCDAWLLLEQDARVHKRGLWADTAPVAPWEWRKENRKKK